MVLCIWNKLVKLVITDTTALPVRRRQLGDHPGGCPFPLRLKKAQVLSYTLSDDTTKNVKNAKNVKIIIFRIFNNFP